MKAEYMSRIHLLPLEVRMKFGELPYQYGMRASTKREKAIEALNESGIDWTEIGTGTNRFIFRYDTYAFKLALDEEGMADNMQEWAICKPLKDVAFAHEISRRGHLLVASYVPAFTSFTEMNFYQDEIVKILKRWTDEGYVLGDVGLVSETYANWGLSNGKPKCIDYGYIFPASLNLFGCVCGSHRMVPLNKTYAEYKCQDCGRRYTDRDLRSRISTEQRIELFKNVRGIEMHSPKEMHEVDDQYAMRNSSGLSDWDVMYSIISKKFFTRGIDDPY